MTAVASPAVAIPAAPKKSALAWVADVLVWGGVAAVLLYSIDAVDLGNISRLFAGNDSTQLFVHDLLRPESLSAPGPGFTTTGDPERFRVLARRFLGPEVADVFGNMGEES